MFPIVVQKARKFFRDILLCLLNSSAQRDSPGSAHSLPKSVTWPCPRAKGGMQSSPFVWEYGFRNIGEEDC